MGKETVVTKVKKLQLYLLFWVKEEDNGGYGKEEHMFSEAAQTRLNNIKESSWFNERAHKVHCPHIQSLDEIGKIINNYINKYGGRDQIETAEIGVFSHSGEDGSICYNTTLNADIAVDIDWPHQMNMKGWGSIDFNWKENGAICVFYGCNSGIRFARNISALSNFTDRNVTVLGQSSFSYPSLYPDYRVTTPARCINVRFHYNISGKTYMVGGNEGQGWGALGLGKHPPAEPLNYYKNGKYLKSNHQGVFNDHRKNEK